MFDERDTTIELSFTYNLHGLRRKAPVDMFLTTCQPLRHGHFDKRTLGFVFRSNTIHTTISMMKRIGLQLVTFNKRPLNRLTQSQWSAGFLTRISTNLSGHLLC